MGIAIALVAALGVAAWLCARQSPGTQRADLPPLRPWGRLSRVPFYLEQPPRTVASTECLVGDPAWHLPDLRTPSQALSLFRRSGVDEADAQVLLEATRCDGGTCITTAPSAVVERLGSEPRGRLYNELARSTQNPLHQFPFTRPEHEPRWIELTSMVTPELLARLEWRSGGEVHISDFEVLCRAARSDEDRMLVVESLSRMSATMAWLTVAEADPIQPLLRYWGRAARTRNIRPILTAFQRVPGGGQLDLIHLLPPFVRRRLNSFPRAGAPPQDCFWSAIHFFDVATPEEGSPGSDGILEALAQDYELVRWEDRAFGDVILFLDQQGTPIHAVNHIADDLVFSKNGYHPRRPWALQSLDEVRTTYHGAPVLRVYHLRELPDP